LVSGLNNPSPAHSPVRPAQDAIRQNLTPMKNHHHQHHAEATKNSSSVIHATIAARAYAIWETNGKPDNQADAHWLEAEQEQITGKRVAHTEATC
jgi:hypothetical protein